MELTLDLWLWQLDVDDAEIQAFERHLSTDEISRGASFVFEKDRRRFIAGRGRLREIMGLETGQAPEKLRLEYDTGGKPYLSNGPAFNLSHSGGWAALVISPGPSIGVDIEAHRPVEKSVADHFFSPNEQTALHNLSDDAWLAAFFRCWTRKEAYLKACGTGLWSPLSSFDVTLDSDTDTRISRIAHATDHPDLWTLLHLNLGPDFTGAIAVRAAVATRIVYHGHHPPLSVQPQG